MLSSQDHPRVGGLDWSFLAYLISPRTKKLTVWGRGLWKVWKTRSSSIVVIIIGKPALVHAAQQRGGVPAARPCTRIDENFGPRAPLDHADTSNGLE